MHAIVAESSDQLFWQEVPDVSAGPGEVLIKVAAAGVNRADVLQAAGKYPPPPGASEIIGMEVSGVVAEVGRGRHRMVRRTRGLRVAGRRRLRRIRRRARRSGAADSRRCRPGRRGGATGGGLHGVVEPGADRSPGRRPAAADARRGQRHRKPRDPGCPGAGRPGGGHRRVGRQAGILPRAGRRDHHQLPRRGFRRAAARGVRRRRT